MGSDSSISPLYAYLSEYRSLEAAPMSFCFDKEMDDERITDILEIILDIDAFEGGWCLCTIQVSLSVMLGAGGHAF